jgi:hypothetical protein
MGCVFSETHLSGDITAVLFDSTRSPFVVDSDVVVPYGKNIAIGPGCVFLFNAYTSLSVAGSIAVNGDSTAPVVFTSANDNTYNIQSKQPPNPFDWNGIVISAEAKDAVVRNFKLMFSVYGIKSFRQNIRIEKGVFRRNGRSHLAVNGVVQQVEDNIPFSIGIPDTVVPEVSLPRAPTETTVAEGDVTLFVRSEPPGAQVLLDGKTIENTTPLTIDKLKPGQYTIRVIKADLSADEEVVVRPGETRQVSLELVKAKTQLKVISSPLDAEVYINKRPNKHTKPDEKTPIVFPDIQDKNVKISLFKIGYHDTAISMPITPFQMNNCFVELSKAGAKEIGKQKKMVSERGKARLSYYFLGGALAAAVGGGIVCYLAQQDYNKADNAKQFLETTVVTSGPVYQSKVQENQDACNAGNLKRNAAIAIWGIGAVALGFGLVFYF